MARSPAITGPYTGAQIFYSSTGSIHGAGQIGVYDQCGASRFTYHYYPDAGGSVLGENELSWGSDAGSGGAAAVAGSSSAASGGGGTTGNGVGGGETGGASDGAGGHSSASGCSCEIGGSSNDTGMTFLFGVAIEVARRRGKRTKR